MSPQPRLILALACASSLACQASTTRTPRSSGDIPSPDAGMDDDRMEYEPPVEDDRDACGAGDGRPCDHDPEEGCLPGEILPDRLIEFRVPATGDELQTIGTNDIGRSFNSRLEGLRFAESFLFDVDDIRLESRDLTTTRTEVIDSSRSEGSRIGFDFSIGSDGGIGLEFGRGMTRDNDFAYMQIVERTSVTFLDDRTVTPAYERLPEDADFYLYGIEFGRAWRLLSSDTAGTNSLNLGFSLSNIGKADGEETGGFSLGFNFTNWSEASNLRMSQEWRGFSRNGEPECNFVRDAAAFERCFMPADPVPTTLIFRNIPRRCIERSSRDDAELPVVLDVTLGELSVEDARGENTDWSLTASCEIDGADSIVVDTVEGVTLEAVNSGESFAIDPTSRRVVGDLGVVPGSTLRCGVSGRVNNGSQTGIVIRYVEDSFVIPGVAGDEAVTMEREIVSNGTGNGPSFRLSYEVQVEPVR